MKKVARLLDWVITRAVAVSVLMILLVICVQVFFRFALNDALSWPEEASRFLMIWALFLGGAYAFLDREHASITFFSSKLPRRVRQINDILIHLIIIVFLGALLYGGWQEMNMLKNMSTGSLRISRAIPYAAIPVSAVIYILFAVRIVFKGSSERQI